MGGSNGNRERRKHPRTIMGFPMEYRLPNMPLAHGALTVNLSESGLLIQSVSNLPVGTKLNVVVLFCRGFGLKALTVSAEIVWKEICWKDQWEGFVYGLRFAEIEQKDLWKLQQLLSGRSQIEETSVSF